MANAHGGPASAVMFVSRKVYHQLPERLLQQILDLTQEAEVLFPPLAEGKHMDPGNIPGAYWKMFLDAAVIQLSMLVAYLQTKIPTVEKDIEAVLDHLNANLRPSIYEDPKREKDVQDVIATLLRARNYDFGREIVRIPYSAKAFVPDFTIEDLSLVVEVKLCDSDKRVKEMVDEINADIPAYQTKYKHLIFVIYDLGFIRDVTQFKSSIEKNHNVHVTIIKK